MVQEDYPGVWRYIILTVSLVEILCFSATIYGWGALVYVLKDEGFLAELCPRHNLTTKDLDNMSHNPSKASINPDCNKRDARFNLYFTLISTIGVFLVLFVGHSLSKLGTRITRLIFITVFGLGCSLIAIADIDHPWLICVGGTLMIGSGNVYIITSIQFTKLFPGHSSTIVGLMNGMKVSSSFTQQLVKLAHDNGISRRISYCCLVGLVSVTYLTTLFLFPKGVPSDKQNCGIVSEEKQNRLKPQGVNACRENESKSLIPPANALNLVKYNTVDSTTDSADTLESNTVLTPSSNENTDDEENGAYDTHFISSSHDTSEVDGEDYNSDTSQCILKVNSQRERVVNDGEPVENNHIKTENCTRSAASFVSKPNNLLSTHMCGYLYIFNVLWFTVIKFWTNYFFGIVNPLTEKITHHNKAKVSYYADVLSYSMAGGIIGCIIVGVLYDWQRRFFAHIPDEKKRRVLSSVCPLITSCIVSVILSSLLFVRDEWVLLAVPIIFTMFRALLTTVGNTFLVDIFPASMYGTIYGVRFVIANIFSLIQYALFEWSLAYKRADIHVSERLIVIGYK